jgi:hypothetical protein
VCSISIGGVENHQDNMERESKQGKGYGLLFRITWTKVVRSRVGGSFPTLGSTRDEGKTFLTKNSQPLEEDSEVGQSSITRIRLSGDTTCVRYAQRVEVDAADVDGWPRCIGKRHCIPQALGFQDAKILRRISNTTQHRSSAGVQCYPDGRKLRRSSGRRH